MRAEEGSAPWQKYFPTYVARMDALRSCWEVIAFPFRLAGWSWEAARWAHTKWKLWKRQPAFGDARLATLRDLKGGEGFLVGRLNGKLIRTHQEACVLMFGARGAGKSLTMGATLHHADGNNLIIQDPPKVLWTRFKDALEAKGYAVVKIDLDDPPSGLGYTPANYLEDSTPLTWDRDLKDIANLIVADIETHGKSGRHFRDMGALFIKGVLGWLYQHDKPKATPYGVAELLLIKTDTQRDAAFKSMLKIGDDSLRLAANAWASVGDNEGGSFRSTLTNALEPWIWRAYRAMTDRDDVLKWEDVLTGDKPCAVFLCGGVLGGETSKHFVRMFFGQAAGSLARLYGKAGPLPRKTHILIDEGSVVGTCKPLVEVVVEMRKAGVTTFLCYQSPSQLYQFMGKDDGATMLSNSDVLMCGGLKAPKDYELVSKLTGSRTVNPLTKGREASFGESPRYILAPEDVFKLPPDKLAAVLGNQTAVLDRAYQIRHGTVRY